MYFFWIREMIPAPLNFFVCVCVYVHMPNACMHESCLHHRCTMYVCVCF